MIKGKDFVEEYIIFGYITYPTQQEAFTDARLLLEQGMVACTNIFQSTSMYRWEEKIEQADEWVMIVKTTESRFDDVVDFVKKHHKYQVPCIVKVPVLPEQNFGTWIKKCVKQ